MLFARSSLSFPFSYSFLLGSSFFCSPQNQLFSDRLTRSTSRVPRFFLNLTNLVLSLLRTDIAEFRCVREHNIYDDIRHCLRFQLMGEDIAHAFEHLRRCEVLRWVVPVRDRVGATIVEARSIHPWVHRGDFDTERCEFGLQPFGYRLERMLAGRVSRGVRNGP